MERTLNTTINEASRPTLAIVIKSLCDSPRLCASALKTIYPYGGSDYAVSADERGNVTKYVDANGVVVASYTYDALLSV